MAYLDTLTKKVNILPTGIPTPVHLSQSENGRTLSFEIVGGSGELPAGSVVTLTGTKPDGVVYSAVGTLSGNIATFEEDVQLTAAAGVWPAKIEVTNGGHMIATGRISFTIDADPVAPGSVPSESELDGLVAQAAMYAETARSAAYGSPLTAATAADMIDTTRVYVYTGSETGMENGHWYYWEDGSWKDGGIYNAAAVQTDTSLSIPGMAADAKATGEAIAAEATAREQADTDLKADLTSEQTARETADNALGEDITALSEDVETNYAKIDGYYDSLGVGMAEQLDSDNYTEDSEPYHFRKSGGGVRVGDREIDRIVGGTVAWNQVAKNFESNTVAGLTLAYDGARFTATGTLTSNARLTSWTLSETENHVYLVYPSRTLNGAYVADASVPSSTLYDSSTGATMFKSDTTSNLDALCLKNRYGGYSTDFNGESFYVSMFDLTQDFGSTIADYIYSLEQSTAGAGVAFLRRYIDIDTYHPYDAGTLKSVEGLVSHDMVGFNQWDEEWEVGSIDFLTGSTVPNESTIRSKNFCKIIPSADYYLKCGEHTAPRYWMTIAYYDESYQHILSYYGAGEVVHVPVNARYFKICTNPSSYIYGTTYNHDICINLSDPSRNGEYEAYDKHSYPLDSSLTLRGIPKLDSANNLYYDGDTYESDGTVTRRYGIVDLGTLNWTDQSETTQHSFYSDVISDAKKTALLRKIPNCRCAKYTTTNSEDFVKSKPNLSITVSNSGRANINDNGYTDAASFKQAMSGVYLVYELATPTTESAEPYTSYQVCDPDGTEEYVTTGDVPVGHETRYPENLRAKIEGLPWDFSSLIAPTEKTTTASRNYTAGSLLIMNNTLYKATANIANGGTITPNTNVTATTLSEILSALAQ